MIHREYDARVINEIINHPEVRPWLGGFGTLDLSPGLADTRNVLLMAGETGGLFFHWQEPGIYEVHTQFLPENRGLAAFGAAREAVDWMFSHTDMCELWTKCPESNRGAKVLTTTLGGKVWFKRPQGWTHGDGTKEAMLYYTMSYGEWAEHSRATPKLGQQFHDDLEARLPSFRPHEDDLTHFAQVGAVVMCSRGGQLAKGVAFYNRWARFACYPLISPISASPPVLDIGDGVKIMLTDTDFEVL